MYYSFGVFILLAQCLGCSSGIGISRHSKRLIGGQKMEESERSSSSLKVLEYYVWIGRAHDCMEDAPWWRRYWSWAARATPSGNNPLVNYYLFHVCPFEKPENLHCGGTLISPYIVQTACHCLGKYEITDQKEWGSVTVWTHLEQDMFIYMGKSNVKTFYHPIKSKQFAAHELCGVLRVPPKYSRYDIGWIILEDDVPHSKGVRKNYWGPVDYAGPYKNAELQQFSNTVIQQRHVCLITGFGRKEVQGTSVSETFRFGWIYILDYIHCYEVLWGSRGWDRRSYDQSCSWVCSQPLNSPGSLSALGAQHYDGDSGSPITCSNHYFAFVSSFTIFKNERPLNFKNMSRETAIRYSPEANAVEYRRTFEGLLQRFGRFNSVENLKYLDKFKLQPPGSMEFGDSSLMKSSSKLAPSVCVCVNTACTILWIFNALADKFDPF